jgi:acetolactate synthase small subunit
MSHHPHTRRLEIVADSDPALLSRICGILANLSLIPDRLQSTIAADDGTVRVAIVTNGWTDRQVDLIARKLSQLPSVHSVSSAIGDIRADIPFL